MAQTAFTEDWTDGISLGRQHHIINGIQKLHLSYTDPDGHNNFPDFSASYLCALENNELEITYLAHTDKATPFNPTNHCYFNLAGESTGANTLLDHIVQIDATATAETLMI